MVVDPVLRNDINHNGISEQDAVKMAIGAAMGISNCRMNSIKVKEDTWYINLINLFGNRSAATSFNTIHINSDILSADELFTLDNLGLAIHEVHHVINQWQGEGMTYTQYFTANNPSIGAGDYHGNNQYEAEAFERQDYYGSMAVFYAEGLL